MFTVFKSVLFTLFALSLIGCSDSTSSNDTRATFALRLNASGSGLLKAQADSYPVTDVGGTVFTIFEARANVRHIQFDFPESSSDTTNKIRLNGPYLVDLMNGSSTPAIGAFDAQPGLYKRIDVRLDDTKAADALLANGDPLMDNTLLVSGSFSYDGSARNFTIILQFNEDIRFEEPGGIRMNEGETNKVILNLNVGEWFEGINITECLDDGDMVFEQNGDLLITDKNTNGKCGNLEQILKTNIKNKYDLN